MIFVFLRLSVKYYFKAKSFQNNLYWDWSTIYYLNERSMKARKKLVNNFTVCVVKEILCSYTNGGFRGRVG